MSVNVCTVSGLQVCGKIRKVSQSKLETQRQTHHRWIWVAKQELQISLSCLTEGDWSEKRAFNSYKLKRSTREKLALPSSWLFRLTGTSTCSSNPVKLPVYFWVMPNAHRSVFVALACSLGRGLPCRPPQLSLDPLPPHFLSRSPYWGRRLKNRFSCLIRSIPTKQLNRKCPWVSLWMGKEKKNCSLVKPLVLTDRLTNMRWGGWNEELRQTIFCANPTMHDFDR